MKSVRNPMSLTVLVCAVLFSVGCVTQHQVKTIVAESNAAMLTTPFLDRAGEDPSPGWQEAVAKIDQLIATYPDQTILINALRMRQAMLLTVNRQKHLAAQVWNRIEANALTTERDQVLFKHKNALMWWYDRAPNKTPLAEDEKELAGNYLLALDESINGLKTTDIRLYLGTIRAQIALKLRHDANVSDANKREQLAKDIADDLLKYVSIFPQADVEWVRNLAGKKITLTRDDMKITDLRYRIWLRDMVIEFRKTAKETLCRPDVTEQCVPGPVPDWKPDWIKDY